MANKIYKFSIGVAIFCVIEELLLFLIPHFGKRSGSFLYDIYLYIGGSTINADLICFIFMVGLALSIITAILFYPLNSQNFFYLVFTKLLLILAFAIWFVLFHRMLFMSSWIFLHL